MSLVPVIAVVNEVMVGHLSALGVEGRAGWVKISPPKMGKCLRFDRELTAFALFQARCVFSEGPHDFSVGLCALKSGLFAVKTEREALLFLGDRTARSAKL